jgi:hypothetical protein
VQKLSIQGLFFGWLILGLDFSGPRLRSWSFHFCVSIFLLAFLSVHCVSSHRRSHKSHRISTLKINIIFCVYHLDHNLSLSMDHQFKEDRWCQDWRFQVSLQRKSISGTYLIYRLFARGRATSKHRGGGRYDAILEFKRGEIKKFKGEQIKNQNSDVKVTLPNVWQKMMRKRKKERDIWEKEKNMSMRKKKK